MTITTDAHTKLSEAFGQLAAGGEKFPRELFDAISQYHAEAATDTGGGGGGAVTSVFTRTGAVVALVGDYNSFFYTEAEVDTLLGGKSNTGHLHDDRYYTEAEVDAALAGKANVGHSHPASDIASGTMATARLGSGTADATTFLRGDNTWQTIPVGGGESNTASNVGTAGVGVFDSKSGVDLRFRKLNPLSARIEITFDDPNDKIDFDVDEASLDIGNLGGSLSFSDITGSLAFSDLTGQIALGQIPDDLITLGKIQEITPSLLGRANAGSGIIELLGVVGGLELVAGVGLNISDDGVTFAKIVNIATDRLLGRDTAGAGNIEELTVGGGIELTGSGGIQTTAFTGDVTKAAGGTALTIANDAVTFAKFQDITTDRLLGRDTAASGNVEELTVGGGIEFTGSGGIQTAAFTGDVTKGAGGTALTIANDAVTFAKMQDIATDKLLGRDTAGSGNVEEIGVTNSIQFDGAGNIRLVGDTASPGNSKLYGTDGSGVRGWFNQPVAGGWTLIKRSTDTNRASNTTLTADENIQVALSASTKYIIRGRLILSAANATMDFKFDFNFSGTTADVSITARWQTTGVAASENAQWSWSSSAMFPSTAQVGTTSGRGYVEFEAYISVTNAGTFSIRWAQNTSDAGNLTSKAGGYLEYVTA